MMIPKSELERAAGILRQGGLVAFPTETVYGLGANALDAVAVRRIYAAKGRPANSPLIVHVEDGHMARQVVSSWPAEAVRLTERFWPGPLTLVLPKQPCVPEEVTAGLGTVGVRQPAHPVAAELIRLAKVPVAAPSANRFMQLSPTTAAHVRAGLGEAVDLILDGGPCSVGIESTVLSLAGSMPVLLRPGMVSREEIESLIGPVQLAEGVSDSDPHGSPGMHSRHYAPRTPLRFGRPDGTSGYIWHSLEFPAAIVRRLPNTPAGYASVLYQVLHEMDASAVKEIVVEPIPDNPEWDGIRDRLQRASAG